MGSFKSEKLFDSPVFPLKERTWTLKRDSPEREWRGGWKPSHCSKHDRGVDSSADPGQPLTAELGDRIEKAWQDGANEPEHVEVLVDGASSKHPCRPNDAPHNRGREESAPIGTREVRRLVPKHETGLVEAQRPSLDGRVYDTRQSNSQITSTVNIA